MANEDLKRDQNFVVVMGGVTDDAAQEIRMLRVDPATGRLIVSMTGVAVAATVDVGTTTTLAPGSAATVVNSGTTSAAIFDFGIPEGEKGDQGDPGTTGPVGMTWLGTYNAGTAYVVDDAVAYGGSSYICIQNGTGQTPDPAGTAYWEVLALKGTNGAGSGDVMGPATNTDNYIPQWDGTDSKTLKNGIDPSTLEIVSNKATDFTTINNTLYPTVEAVNNAINTAVVGLLDYRGSYDASVNTFPATGGSGLAGAILKGDFWIASVGGTLGGTVVTVGDLIIALQDTPAQTASNWDIISNELGYTPENVANKVTSISGASTDVQYPSAKLLYDQLVLKLGTTLASANIFVGNGSNIATAVALTGDAALSNTGVLGVNKTRLNIRNETGSTIVSTKVVYVSGFNNFPLITLADNTDEAKHGVVGVTIAPIAHEANGFIATDGQFDAETNSWTVGTTLYLSTAGALTSTMPTSGAVKIIGTVTVQANYPTGKILLTERQEENIVAGGANTDVILRAGDTAGTNKISFRDYTNNEVAYVNSDGRINSSILTASELLATDASKNIVSLAVATYPSLTELSYVKGVTSAIQTQIGTKANSASPTFTGTLTIADNTRIDLTLPTADTYCTGNTTDSFASGYSSSVGDLVFFGSGGKWLEVDSNAVATCNGLMGIALEAKTDTQAMKVALPGSFFRLDSWNWTVGATLYAGETLGAMQETIPTGADAIIKVIGFAVSADVIFFNPSPDQQSTVA